ncbi:MAG: hypothetical protein LWX52_03585 [Deltaproteobacteria bacterium]|jgi:hypothetical protein|nr:hypothetical protein [Deltaproteobacteria bacterium]
MKKITGLVLFVTILIATASFAETYSDDMYTDEPKTASSKETFLAALYANDSSLETRFDYKRDFDPGSLIAGFGAIWHENNEKYDMYDLMAGMESEALTTNLRFALGIKGLLGDAKKTDLDGDLLALGFLVSASYDLPEMITPIPTQVYASFCMAPGPLCYQDSKSYRDVNAGMDFYIIERAAIVLRYKYLRVHFDESVSNWRFSDESVFLGFKLKF